MFRLTKPSVRGGGDTTPPTVPTNLAASPGDSQVSLSWTASNDNGGGDQVTGYDVFRDGVKVGSPTGTSYTDTGLTNGTTYAYTVDAIDQAGNTSAKTAGVTATPTAPANGACNTLDGGLGDGFNTNYNAPMGLNPNACGAVNPTLPGDDGPSSGTWVRENGAGGNCINQGTSPTPGEGSGAVKFSATAGSGGSTAQDCLWMGSWRYMDTSADVYYGLMWYFPSTYQDPAPGGHDRISEFNWHPYIDAGPLGFSLHNDLQWIVATGQDCTNCVPQYHNDGEYANPPQSNLGPITDWQIIPPSAFATGKWYETIVHVHEANNATGSVQAWYRVKGDSTWIKTIDKSGFPTIQWGPDQNQNFTWTANNEQGVTTQDHIGIYRTSANPAPATSFWIDNYQRRTTFDAVANTMP